MRVTEKAQTAAVSNASTPNVGRLAPHSTTDALPHYAHMKHGDAAAGASLVLAVTNTATDASTTVASPLPTQRPAATVATTIPEALVAPMVVATADSDFFAGKTPDPGVVCICFHL